MKNKAIIKLVIFTAILFSLPSCKDEKTVHYSTMTFPLIQECKDQVVSHFETDWIKDKLEYEIHLFNFNMPMEFYSNLIGFVKVSLIEKDSEPDKYLESIINGPMLDCYPRAYSKIDLKELPELQKALEFNRNFGDRPSYLRIVDDKLRIYSNN